ncbi:hypothetical protein CBR_g55277 [Chara braunii]|uniref:DUF659 domain-containing protein n=1 Tax=Chara braunii TaxID=69332 RepID=A0A388MD29_CHABU|nr:hypothetical protein CBR_g55277 [Chara braunii]|eukprot:GBG92369.1 hypothetical protein CBR_g55277 [Chara braunii]
MLRCTFCNKVFQGTQFYATKHFTQQNYCKKVFDDVLYQIVQKCTHRFKADQVERVWRFAHERGLDVPRSGAMGGEAERPAQGVGEGEDTERYAEGGVARYGEGAGNASEDEADVDLEVGMAEGERTPRGEGGVPNSDPMARQRAVDSLDWERNCGKKPVLPEMTCTLSSSKSVVPDRACTPGSSKRKEGGAHVSATNAGKRLRQQKMMDTYGGEWIGQWRKAFFRWLYSSGIAFNAFHNTPYRDLQQVALRQPGGAPLLVLPSHNEIASMRAVEIHREELAEELEEFKQSLWMSGATLLSDGRKSRDGRPIVNFPATGSRGVITYTTINRKGEPDDAVHVLQNWVAIFHGFRFGGPQRVNAICTDSASAYVGAAMALASPSIPPQLRRITWLPCCVHVCNKLLSDIGTICTSFVDAITRVRVLVVFFKTHQTALSFFHKRSEALGLVLSCETRFASVYSMLERLLALQDRLQGMMTREDGRARARIPWSRDVRDMARWVCRQIRWSPWWERMRAIKHVMDPVMDLLRRMDRGGQFMSLVVEWTRDLARLVRDACIPLGQSFSDRVMRRVQARIQHMMEPAHCAAFLLNPRRRDVQYFSSQLDGYHTWLVRQAKRYLLSQTGHDESGGRYLEVCRQFEDFHMQQGRYGTWGGAEGLARARSCSGDCEMLECASWWSQYRGDAPDLQHCAFCLMHMWPCTSPAERNWAVHEGIHTKKRNQLAFEKVVHLVEITANVRLMEYRRAGCGYVLPWQRDKGMLDAQAGLDVEPVCSGTRSGMTEEEIEEQAALIVRDPIGASALPPVESVFSVRVTIIRPYPRDDDSADERESEAEGDTMLPIPCETDELHEEGDVRDERTHTVWRAAEQRDMDMIGGRGEQTPATTTTREQTSIPVTQSAPSSQSPLSLHSIPASAPTALVRHDERSLAPVGREDLGSSLRIRGHGSLFSVARQLVLDPRASSDLGEMGVHSGAPPVEERERRAEEHGASGAGGVEGIWGMEEEVAGAVGGVVAVDDGAHVEREEVMVRVDDGEQVEGVEGVLPSEVEREHDVARTQVEREHDVARTQVEREEGVAGVDDGDAQVEMEEDTVRADAAALVGGEEGVVGGDVAHGRGEGGDDLDPIVQRFIDDEIGPALAGLTPGTRRALGASPSGQRGASGLGMGDFMDMSLGDPHSSSHSDREDVARALAAAGYSTEEIEQAFAGRSGRETDTFQQGCKEVVEQPQAEREDAPAADIPGGSSSLVPFTGMRMTTTMQPVRPCVQGSDPGEVAFVQVPPLIVVDLGSEPALHTTVTGRRAPQDTTRLLDFAELAWAAVRDVTWQEDTDPSRPLMPPPPPRSRHSDSPSTPVGRPPRSPSTPTRPRVRDTTVIRSLPLDTSLFGRTNMDLESAALAAAARAVRDQTSRTSGVARPHPMPATGGAALEESSGAEGLGMPRCSRREKTVAEVTQVSARLVRVRMGDDPVTVVEDDPETEPACEEAPQKGDEYRDDKEREEEESDSGDDDSYHDDDDEPSPPPRHGSRRRRGSRRRHDDVDDPSPPGQRETRSRRRQGSSVATASGRGSVSSTRSTSGARQSGSDKGKGSRRY